MGEHVEDDFEWDDDKSERCLRRHGFDFDVAKRIFAGPHVIWEDDRKDYGEERNVAVGLVDNMFLTVIYTERPPRVRVIASWESEDEEIEEYIKFYGI